MTDDGGLDLQSDSGHGEKWADLKYDLEVDLTGELREYICVRVKGERIKDDSDFLAWITGWVLVSFIKVHKTGGTGFWGAGGMRSSALDMVGMRRL